MVGQPRRGTALSFAAKLPFRYVLFVTDTSPVAVVVLTYRHPAELSRCLAGLAHQSCPPAHLIVVVRPGDHETLAQLDRTPVVHTRIAVSEPRAVHALAAGSRAVHTDIVAFTDDDAVRRPEWIARMLQHFADPGVGGGAAAI